MGTNKTDSFEKRDREIERAVLFLFIWGGKREETMIRDNNKKNRSYLLSGGRRIREREKERGYYHFSVMSLFVGG